MKFLYAQEDEYEYISKNDKHLSKSLISSKIRNKEIIIIYDDLNKTGWLRYGYFWDNIPFMNMLWINEEYRSKGIGREIVLFWEREMKSKGYGMIMTSTLSNEEAQQFYRKLGYKDSGSLLLENEPLEILFTKKL